MYKKFFLTICLSVFLLPLFADELTLDQALAAAKENNGTIKVATLTMQQSMRNAEVNSALPSINLTLGATATSSITDQSASLSVPYSAGVSFSFGSSNLTDAENSKLSKKSASAAYQSTLNTVSSNVTTAYWNAVATGLDVQSKQSSLEKAQDSLDSVNGKYEGGKATTLAVRQAELSVSEAEYSLSTSKQSQETAMETLRTLTGLDGDWDFQDMPESITLKSLDVLYPMISQTTAMETYQIKVDQAKVSQKSLKYQYVTPTFNVSANVGTSSTSLFTASTGSGVAGPNFNDKESVSVTMSIPLDHLMKGSQASVSLDSAKYAISIAEQNYDNKMTDLKTSVKNAWVSINQAYDNLAILADSKNIAEEQLKLSQDSYDAGMLSYNDLKTAKLALENAELNILQQKLNYTIALYDLSSYLETPITNLSV